ncbi:hypothetical protein FRC03_001572 [Tulasnella sp. 419]|nr:hypothetical protein FRC03_001572 [Tulasnella sp. 419]
MGLKVNIPPRATFYIWLDLSGLPQPLDNGLTFFEELLKEKTIVVPGIFFDINPSHRRDLFESSCHHFVRISFGPPLDVLDKGLDAIERVVKKMKHEGMESFGGDYAKSPIQLEFEQRWADVDSKVTEESKTIKEKVTGLLQKITT